MVNEAKLALSTLNQLPADAFAASMAPVFENAAWITQYLASARPFASVTALHAAMLERLYAAPEAEQITFLRGHPMLSPATLQRGTTRESTAEQISAGLLSLDQAATARLDAANDAYVARFGFPFILAVRHASLPTILGAMERRSTAAPAAELAEALREVEAISWMRLLDRVTPAATGGISLHVLDTVRTRPAAGLAGELWHVPPNAAAGPVARFITDTAGRAAATPGDGTLTAGDYEWRLDTAAYFARSGVPTLDRSFLPTVCVRFTVFNPEQHFHVPVLLSQGSYTTYRGS
jgi:2-oxo-4-hydroxy-4-carboxy-5-ureidoimidazoline decarboxylase